jgi:transketolase
LTKGKYPSYDFLQGRDILTQSELRPLLLIALETRKRILRMIVSGKGGHTGGSLSSVDILVSLYFHALRIDPKRPDDPGRDRFVMSKGHSAEGLYCVLSRAGFFPDDWLSQYGSFGSHLYGHPTMGVPGVEMPTGALGHGLSLGVGMALAAKRDGAACRTFVLMGDGEQAEGSIWEAAMAGSHYGLDNLVGIVDYNGLQISGKVDGVMGLSPLADRWAAFGWKVVEIDGNDMGALASAFDALPARTLAPTLVLAHTVKGKGVSFIENQVAWHHKVPTAEELETALGELDDRIAELGGAKGGSL